MLSQLQITNTKPKEKPYMHPDGHGLHLYIPSSGSKLWRLRYRFAGKANMLSLGALPETSLAEARKKRDAIRAQIAAGTDPSLKRKTEKIEKLAANKNTFGVLAIDYLKGLEEQKAAPATISKNTWLLEVLAAPLKNRPVAEITPAELLILLKKIEGSGRRESARRLRGIIGSVFRFGIANLRATTDPTYALRGSLLKANVRHRPAITEEKGLGILWAQLENYEGWPILNAALRLLILTMARPGDVRHMRKTEVDFEKKVWKIPAQRMKMRRPHDVPLSRQALAVLEHVWPESSALVFPSLRSANK